MSSEIEYLNKCLNKIRKIIQKKEKTIEIYKKDVISEKSELWKSISEITDTEMYSRMREEDLNVDMINDAIIKVAKLYKSLETPYFGKVVFNGESLYFGLTGVNDEEEVLVYDWRAPVSNLYYNFELGDAHYNAIDEQISGVITSKRQFIIEMGKLIDFFDLDIAIDDKVLQDVLRSNRDDKMKNIVSTIQKEQNMIIKYAGNKNLIIEGIAGSGKTEIALHRIAYLLYNKENLSNKNVLIISPNKYFTEYISNVLPELGEENVKTITYIDLFKKSVINSSKVETLNTFIDLFYTGKKNTSICKLKLSSKYKEILDEYIRKFLDSIVFKKSLGLKTTLIKSSDLNKLFHDDGRNLSFSSRISYIAEKICDKWDISLKNNLEKAEKIIFNLLSLEKDPIKIYNDFLASESYLKYAKDRNFIVKDDASSEYIIPYEDLFGISYLYFELFGYPNYGYVKELVIDEAQDYSMNDYHLLKKIFKSATFTILGDKNQVINPYNKYRSLEEIGTVFKNHKYLKLNKSYRSSSEITKYTSKIIGLTDVETVQRPSGREVVCKREKNLREDLIYDISYLKKLGYKKIAIITKTREECAYIKNLNMDNDAIIIPSHLSKGLEFDAVISYNRCDNKYVDSEKYLLYTVLTRAEHELIIYNNI